MIGRPQATLDVGRYHVALMTGEPRVRLLFVDEVTSAIGSRYADISRAFAETLCDVYDGGRDPNGFFTLGKDIWVIRDATSEDIVGFEVITRKRGGSIKLGPTIVRSRYRGQGVARAVLPLLVDQYEGAGARKVYVTAPSDDTATAALDFGVLQLRVEALLRKHYRDGAAERVSGRILHAEEAASQSVCVRLSSTADEDLSWRVLTPQEDPLPFVRLAHAGVATCYDDIDEQWARDLFVRATTGASLNYEAKAKRVVVIERRGVLEGMVVCTPKRGGSVKVGPAVLSEGCASKSTVEGLISLIMGMWPSAHKLLFVVPMVQWNIVVALSAYNAELEGILQSPYRPGVDVALMALWAK